MGASSFESDSEMSTAAEVHLLRAENAALRAELAALRSAAGTSGADAARTIAQGLQSSAAWYRNHRGKEARQSAGGSRSQPSHSRRPSGGAPVGRSTSPRPRVRTWTSPGAGEVMNGDDLERYARQLSLPTFGAARQARLARASVLLVGVGGLGSPAALYLAGAGVGRISLADADVVETSNLHRQIIHTEDRTGRRKAVSGAAAVLGLNSKCAVTTHIDGVTQANALALVKAHDVVMDCTDNVQTRYLLSDACAVAGVPLVSAAAVSLEGQLTVYCRERCPGATPTQEKEDVKGTASSSKARPPCYRCVFPRAPAAKDCTSCARGGVLGPVPGVMGVLQALECVKVITGLGDTLAGRLLMFDAASASRPFATVKLRGRDPTCAACGDRPTLTEKTLGTYDYLGFVSGGGVAAACPAPTRAKPSKVRETAVSAPPAVPAIASTLVAPGTPSAYELDDAAAAARRNASWHRGDGGVPWGTEADARPRGGRGADPALHGAAPWATHDAPSSAARTRPKTDGRVAERHVKPPATSTSQTPAVPRLDVSAPVPRLAREPGPNRVTPEELHRALRAGAVVLDVRPRHLFTAAALRGAVNVPLSELEARLHEVRAIDARAGLYCVCSRGNDSQRAEGYLRAVGVPVVGDVLGGLERWKEDVDASFPKLV